MNRKLINFLLKFGVIVAIYVIAARYIDNQYIFYVTIGFSFVYVVFRMLSKKDPKNELVRYSNASNFIRLSEKAFIKNQTKLSVYLAYGKLYEGEMSDSKQYLSKVNIEALKEDVDTYHLYLQTLLRHEYEEGSIEGIEEIFKIALADTSIHPNTENIAKLMIFMIEKKYQEALEALLDMIPKEDRRHVIMELETILGEVYILLNQLEDAKAVLEFVASRKYQTIHIEKAKSMLVNLS